MEFDEFLGGAIGNLHLRLKHFEDKEIEGLELAAKGGYEATVRPKINEIKALQEDLLKIVKG